MQYPLGEPVSTS